MKFMDVNFTLDASEPVKAEQIQQRYTLYKIEALWQMEQCSAKQIGLHLLHF